jgi:hypothetical protein
MATVPFITEWCLVKAFFEVARVYLTRVLSGQIDPSYF